MNFVESGASLIWMLIIVFAVGVTLKVWASASGAWMRRSAQSRRCWAQSAPN
jgi:hypothetical protein